MYDFIILADLAPDPFVFDKTPIQGYMNSLLYYQVFTGICLSLVFIYTGIWLFKRLIKSKQAANDQQLPKSNSSLELLLALFFLILVVGINFNARVEIAEASKAIKNEQEKQKSEYETYYRELKSRKKWERKEHYRKKLEAQIKLPAIEIQPAQQENLK